MKYLLNVFLLPTVLTLIFTVGCSTTAKKNQAVLYSICESNNLFSIYDHESLAYTFNAQLPDKTIHRNWQWNIKTNQIFLDGSEHETSQKFINDIYWLLFPLKAYENIDNIKIAVNYNQKSPLQDLDCTEVIIQYISGEGYTPNDIYKLYVDDEMYIREWSYLKEGIEPPARITTWNNYREINHVMFSLMREGSAGFKVWFTNIHIE